VLADKPWLVEPADLEHVRASLEGWPLAAEIMTGRHDVAAGLVKRLVGAAALFGAFRDGGPAIAHESVHHLEKLVDGVPLGRPWWYFDVRVQGSGPVDIPTHVACPGLAGSGRRSRRTRVLRGDQVELHGNVGSDLSEAWAGGQRTSSRSSSTPMRTS
jgi:hypothetical protein